MIAWLKKIPFYKVIPRPVRVAYGSAKLIIKLKLGMAKRGRTNG